MLYPLLATLSFAILLGGFAQRRKSPRLHASLMGASMLIDLGLVLTLELTRNAVATAVGPHLTHAQQAHVLSSSLAVLVYLPVIGFGFVRLFRPTAENLPLRGYHRRLGYAALVLRAVSYVFMFSMIGR